MQKLFFGLIAVNLILLVSGCQQETDPASDTAAEPTQVEAQAERPPEHCPTFVAGKRNVYWGDLHVHSSLSLDAYAFGTIAGPEDAFAYAKGEPIDLFRKSHQLERPLDFTAVTDHAEWLDLLYICTNPGRAEDPYCTNLRQEKSPLVGGAIFSAYVVPTITQEKPMVTPICKKDPERCADAAMNQWARSQRAANEANDPCNFTALIGYEWSATPSYSHTHRNLIFKNSNVTRQAIDYIRYPAVSDLWEQLNLQCREEDNCDVIAIPHNTNMGDGVSFDVETESEAELLLRAKYERLVEIHQDKGNSECLAPFGSTDESDCNFELYLTDHSRPQPADAFSEGSWEKSRSTYVRSLLLRGLAAYDKNPEIGNPLQLGLIGSTDTHTATPGRVTEARWQGEAFSQGNINYMMQRVQFNAGGLVAVWAEENTREAIFDALKRREVYGTSGPRIELKFSAKTEGEELNCSVPDSIAGSIRMGGEFSDASQAPSFQIEVKADRMPLSEIEIIKGTYVNGDVEETVASIWMASDETYSACVNWTDDAFDTRAPAFWYTRVKEVPVKRWSKVLCEEAGRCDEFPEAVKDIQERAWASPIWYLPTGE